MVFRSWCKHCHCLYIFLSCIYTCTHVHSSDFAKLAIPQVEILGMFGLLAFVSTPDRHPGGSVCTWLFYRHDQAFPWIRDQRRNQIRQLLQKFESKPCCFYKILHMDRDVQGRKSWYSEAPWNSRSNASKINEFEDPYKEIWQEHWTLHVLKFDTNCSAGIKWT